jgi:hypothetical protein
LGFEKRRPRTNEGRENRYQRDPTPKKNRLVMTTGDQEEP